jgi:hypothetical protein
LFKDEILKDSVLLLSKRGQENIFTDFTMDNITNSNADEIIVTDSDSKIIYIKNLSETGINKDSKRLDTTFQDKQR